MRPESLKIDDEDRVLRRVFFTDPRYYVKPDMTATSFAFKLRRDEDGLSVDIEKLTTYEKSILDSDRFRLFALRVEVVRSKALECIHKPIADNYAHAEIVGEGLKRRVVCSSLAKSAVYIHYPS